MKRLSRYMEKVVFVLMILLVASIFTNLQAQNVPTDGKKTISVSENFEGEFEREVYESFMAAPKKYHLKKLPKLLAKYGFTNIEITAFGSVEYESTGYKPSRMDVALAQLGSGSGVAIAVSTATTEVNEDKFQANFTSDQGTFKVRLNIFVKPRYIIKENQTVAQN